MSEEKRSIKNKKVIALSISLVVAVVFAGILGISFISVNNNYNDLSGDYDSLYIDYLELSIDFNTLNDQYFILTGEHIELENDYNALVTDLADMTTERNALDEEIQTHLGTIAGLEQDIQTHLGTIAGLEDEIEALDLEIYNLGITIGDLGDTIDAKDLEIYNLGITIGDLNAQIGNLNTQVVGLEAQILALQGEKQDLIDYYEGIIAGLNTQITTLTTERDNLIIDLNAMTGERDQLLIDLATANALISSLESDLNAMTLERDKLIIDLNAMTGERDQLLIDLATANALISSLESDLVIMTGLRDGLESDLNILQLQYDTLFGDYQILFDAYVNLLNTYDALLIAYNYICNTIKQSILPVQFSVFAEAVRRYYMDIYLEGLSGKDYWISFAEFCRDIILHDSWQYNSFNIVSNAFSDALISGSDTMALADYIMYWTFYNWLPNWRGYGLTGDELTDINTIVDWSIANIDYEYDSNIIVGQETFNWDYIKFPVETAFRTMGDCEDQAILTATYLESCGFETAIAISHDSAHPTLGDFYHGSVLVYIEDSSAFWALYPTTPLWDVPVLEGMWYWIDTTWDVPFGSVPSWLQAYRDFGGLTTLVVTTAECNIGGNIGTNTGGNTGITCVMPS